MVTSLFHTTDITSNLRSMTVESEDTGFGWIAIRRPPRCLSEPGTPFAADIRQGQSEMDEKAGPG